MLIEFSVSNFRSFKKKQTLSLVASPDKTHEGNLIRGEKFDLLKVAAIYGANASGKSNLLSAIGFVEWFVRKSATGMNPGDKIGAAIPFRLDAEMRDEPSSFEMTIAVDGVRYEYGFSVTTERVYDEWLIAYPKGKAQHWFEREFEPEKKRTIWDFKNPLKRDAELLREKTRDNSLVLSSGANLNIGPLSQLYLWFSERLWTFDLSSPPLGLVQATARYIEDKGKVRNRVAQLLKHADLGISSFDLVEQPLKLSNLPESVREMLSEENGKQAGQKQPTIIKVQFAHNVPKDDTAVLFDLEADESNGTQRLFALAGPLLDMLDRGAAMVVDELECSMHPLLTRKVIELVQSPEANKKGAQLIFATHDNTLMDPGLFRRDQIWLTEKDSSGATELFSLYDFKTEEGKPRVNEAFQRRYLAGRYGAVPRFGPALEDAELE